MEVQVIHHEIPGPIGNPIPMHISRQKLSGRGNVRGTVGYFPLSSPGGMTGEKCPTVRILPDSVHYVTDEYVWRAFTTR